MTYLSELLRLYRETAELTQKQLSDQIGINRSTYAYYEIGRSQPDWETLVVLQKTLNIPPEQFFPDDPSVLPARHADKTLRKHQKD